jgi:uncharacterized DUF497 family protein
MRRLKMKYKQAQENNIELNKVLFLSGIILLGLSMVATEPFNIIRLYIAGGVFMLIVIFTNIFKALQLISCRKSKEGE